MLLSTISFRSLKSFNLNKILLCIILLLLPGIAGLLSPRHSWGGTLCAQSVSINPTGNPPNASAVLDVNSANKGLLIPRINLTGSNDVATIPTPANSLLIYNNVTAGTSPNNVVPGYYFWNGVKWIALSGQAGRSTIAFSTGSILSGSSVVSAQPILMGFASHSTEVINGAGESTSPPEAGGFAFSVPFSGTIQNLEVSADLLVASNAFINTTGLQYDFSVFVSPSIPNNGIDHSSSQYVTTPLTSSVRFGFPNTIVFPGNFRSSTNFNNGSITVNAGDRIGIRVRTLQSTDQSAFDITQLSFNASFSYTPSQ